MRVSKMCMRREECVSDLRSISDQDLDFVKLVVGDLHCCRWAFGSAQLLHHVGKTIAVLTVFHCFGTRLLFVPNLVQVSLFSLTKNVDSDIIELNA